MKQESARPLMLKATAAISKGKYAGAEDLLKQAVQIAPHYAEALLLLAEDYEHQGKTQDAMDVYHSLVYSQGWGSSINSSPNTSFRYMLLLVKANRLKEAGDMLARANRSFTITTGHPIIADIAPHSQDPIALEAAAHLGLGISTQSHMSSNTEEQLHHIKKALALKPDSKEAQAAYQKALQMPA